MKKNSQNFIPEIGWARNFISNIFIIMFIMVIFLLSSCLNIKDKSTDANLVEVYRVNWWGAKGSVRSRPPTGVINIDNGKLVVRHSLQEGRALGDYRLPYWGVNSFVSIFSKSAELAHNGSVSLTIDGKKMNLPFRLGNEKYQNVLVNMNDSLSLLQIEKGFDLAHIKKADVLKVTCLGIESPILIENFFYIYEGSNYIPVVIRATNTSALTIKDIEVQTSYAQNFNWNYFGSSKSKKYQQVKAPLSDTANAFFAFSSGMERGFEFNQVEGCKLSYTLNSELNAWKVNIQNTATELTPGASIVYQYNLRIIDKPPVEALETKFISKQELDKLVFTKLKPTVVKNAPVNRESQVTINNIIQNLNKPKVRGLNLRANFSNAFTDIAMIKEWGGNLIIIPGIGNPQETRQIVERGHELGMEMFIQGDGSYREGVPPNFDRYFTSNLKPSEYPDSYGQDEDHYYWYPVKPTVDFEADFGKVIGEATQKDKASYWSRCFADKWHKTLNDVNKKDPNAKIWFYTPTPSIANIDPLDYYDLFFSEMAKFGDKLTVFPFYYGVDYNQVEYLIRRWKDAGVNRVVFLPMRGYMAKPSQFLRAVTAARRGGADGSCGFSFAVGEELPENAWQWKSVMLAALANFPTPELKAYCFIEEPAKLVETLATKDICVFAKKAVSVEFIQKLKKLLPGQVTWVKDLPENYMQSDKMYVVVGDDVLLDGDNWAYDKRKQELGPHKGVLQMSGTVVSLNGTDTIGLKNAEELFLRFAELALAESRH
jgi:hypothetical protein